MRALACNAIRTASSANLAGYQISDLCQLCCKEPDTIWHRLWECSACADVRQEAVDEDVLEAARLTEAEDYEWTLWMFGAFRHPGDYFPRPDTSADVLVNWNVEEMFIPGSLVPTATSPQLGVWGPLFVDGSCIRHPVAELSRSAWCVSMVDPQARLLCKCLPQFGHRTRNPLKLRKFRPSAG